MAHDPQYDALIIGALRADGGAPPAAARGANARHALRILLNTMHEHALSLRDLRQALAVIEQLED